MMNYKRQGMEILCPLVSLVTTFGRINPSVKPESTSQMADGQRLFRAILLSIFPFQPHHQYGNRWHLVPDIGRWDSRFESPSQPASFPSGNPSHQPSKTNPPSSRGEAPLKHPREARLTFTNARRAVHSFPELPRSTKCHPLTTPSSKRTRQRSPKDSNISFFLARHER